MTLTKNGKVQKNQWLKSFAFMYLSTFDSSKQCLSREGIIFVSQKSGSHRLGHVQSTAFSVVASGLVKMSPVPLLKDSRGSSFGLLGLLGHSFVIMTSDLCRPVCCEECRRCLPSVRLMVSRWLLFFQSGMFFWARIAEGCYPFILSLQNQCSNMNVVNKLRW